MKENQYIEYHKLLKELTETSIKAIEVEIEKVFRQSYNKGFSDGYDYAVEVLKKEIEKDKELEKNGKKANKF